MKVAIGASKLCYNIIYYMYRPLISFILIVAVAVAALLASGMVEVDIDIRDQDGNPIKRKKQDKFTKTEDIAEAEIVEDEDE